MEKRLTEKMRAKRLDAFIREELQKNIDLYKNNRVIDEALSFIILDDEYKFDLLEKYKRKLYKIFNPSNIVRIGFSLEKAQAILPEFSSVC